MQIDDNVKHMVSGWLIGLVLDIFDEGIVKLISRSAKCLERNGDYVEIVEIE